MSGEKQTQCVICWVYGLVQGVGFRYCTQREAQKLGVTGYARNLDDGSVEVLICGEPGPVDSLLTWLKNGGPTSARVDKVLAQPHHSDRHWPNFSIRY